MRLNCKGSLPARQGAIINVLGAGAAMIGLQATIGLLVAKTLTSATVNPFLASTTSSWNPVLAFDVFNVQVGAYWEGSACCQRWCQRGFSCLRQSLVQSASAEPAPAVWIASPHSTPNPSTLLTPKLTPHPPAGHHQLAAVTLLQPGVLTLAAAHHRQPAVGHRRHCQVLQASGGLSWRPAAACPPPVY